MFADLPGSLLIAVNGRIVARFLNLARRHASGQKRKPQD